MDWPATFDDETHRLAALNALMILDTTAEERFDRVVQFAARELVAPISLISLIDDHRQWFKAKVGLSVSETPRDIAFCSHAIASQEVFVVEDALLDPRFLNNPLVIGDPHIRFYAGAPISAPGGHRIGTICVIDRYPRKLGKLDRSLLDSLRYLIDDMLAGKEVSARAQLIGL